MLAPRLSFVVTTIIEIVLFWVMLLIIINVFINTYAVVQINEVQRFTQETADNIMEAPSITAARGVFSAEKLAEIQGTNFEPVRPCIFGSRYMISILGENGEPGKSWEFGYPVAKLGEVTVDFVRTGKTGSEASYSVWVKDGEVVAPARMTVKLLSSDFTDIYCGIQKAAALGFYEMDWRCEHRGGNCIIKNGEGAMAGSICMSSGGSFTESLLEIAFGPEVGDVCRQSPVKVEETEDEKIEIEHVEDSFDKSVQKLRMTRIRPDVVRIEVVE